MKSVTIFCGSSNGTDPVYRSRAVSLGRILANEGIEVIYGGAKVGLMGAVADAVLSAGGKVTGIIPRFLRSKEIAHEGLTKLVMVESMHERKTQMHEMSDGIIALPGGFGTLEELFEMLTWAQLGLHKKPIGLLDINGFYDHLKLLLKNMVANGFLKEINYNMLLISDDTNDLLGKMKSYVAPDIPKWISEDEV
ncbi:MAG TPA: TIGR00730 family Rossman fold protein [Chryseolinea sp.]